MDLSTYPIVEIKSIFREFGKICVRQAVLKDNFIIARMRKGVNYRLLSDISCPPARVCKCVQRCSLSGQSVFYSSLTDDKRHLEKERYLNLCECSSLAKEGINSIGRELLLCHIGELYSH